MRGASPEELVPVRAALGAPLDRFEELPALLRERCRHPWQRGMEPVIVVWDGQPLVVKLVLPRQWAANRVTARDGHTRRGALGRHR